MFVKFNNMENRCVLKFIFMKIIGFDGWKM